MVGVDASLPSDGPLLALCSSFTYHSWLARNSKQPTREVESASSAPGQGVGSENQNLHSPSSSRKTDVKS